jgi:hypothetical protein
LRAIGTENCIKQADVLAQNAPIQSLYLRSLDLTAADVIAIAACLGDYEALSAISLSYNHIENKGAIALSHHLPQNIKKIGFVNCDMGDAGGIAILEWMQTASQLRMICIEQNNFSPDIKKAYKEFSQAHPQIIMVV